MYFIDGENIFLYKNKENVQLLLKLIRKFLLKNANR